MFKLSSTLKTSPIASSTAKTHVKTHAKVKTTNLEDKPATHAVTHVTPARTIVPIPVNPTITTTLPSHKIHDNAAPTNKGLIPSSRHSTISNLLSSPKVNSASKSPSTTFTTATFNPSHMVSSPVFAASSSTASPSSSCSSRAPVLASDPVPTTPATGIKAIPSPKNVSGQIVTRKNSRGMNLSPVLAVGSSVGGGGGGGAGGVSSVGGGGGASGSASVARVNSNVDTTTSSLPPPSALVEAVSQFAELNRAGARTLPSPAVEEMMKREVIRLQQKSSGMIKTARKRTNPAKIPTIPIPIKKMKSNPITYNNNNEDTKILHDERISEILCSPLPALVDDKQISSPISEISPASVQPLDLSMSYADQMLPQDLTVKVSPSKVKKEFGIRVMSPLTTLETLDKSLTSASTSGVVDFASSSSSSSTSSTTSSCHITTCSSTSSISPAVVNSTKVTSTTSVKGHGEVNEPGDDDEDEDEDANNRLVIDEDPQTLILNGKKYSIVQIAQGKWVSQNEYDLSRDLENKEEKTRVNQMKKFNQ